MKKSRKLWLFLISVVLIALCIFAFTACNKNKGGDDDGGDPYVPPQDETLDAGQIKNLLNEIRVPVNTSVKMTEGYGELTIDYNVNGTGYIAIRREQFNGSGMEQTFVNLKGADYVMVTRIDNAEGEMRYLADWEVELEKKKAAEELDISAKQIEESVLEGHYEAKAVMGSAAGEPVYSGMSYADGRYSVTMELTALQGEYPYDYRVNFEANSEKHLTKIYMQATVKDGYLPDNYEKPEPESFEISFDYAVSSTNESGRYQGSDTIYLSFANGAQMPDTFEREVAIGRDEVFKQITLPEPTNAQTDGFRGWYYDEELQYPVPEKGDGEYLLTLSDGVEYMTVYAKWYKKDNATPFLSMANGDKLDADDAKEVKYTFILSDFMHITPIREGSSFVGWYKDKDFTQPLSYDDNYICPVEQVLYAKFVKNIKVEFAADVDYEILPQFVEPDGYADLPEAVKKGYFFDGWYTDENHANPAGDRYPEADCVYYAKFIEGVNINISVPEGISGVPKYFTVPKQGNMENIEDELRRYVYQVESDGNGKVFDHWAIDTNGTELTSYPNSEITVYAYYTEPIYISYKFDKSVSAKAESRTVQRLKWDYSEYNQGYYDYLESLRYDSDNVVPQGKDFDGWYSDEACTVKITENTPWPDRNSTAFGQYVDKKRFTFVFNGATYDGTEEALYEYSLYGYANSAREVLNIVGVMPAADEENGFQGGSIICPQGKYLEGWYTDSQLTERFVAYDTLPDKSMTLYAKFADIGYVNFVMPDRFNDCEKDYAVMSMLKEISTLDYITAKKQYENYNGAGTYSFAENYIGMQTNVNAYIRFPDDPDYIVHYFEGYYTDEECTERYEFGAEFVPVTVYLNWAQR